MELVFIFAKMLEYTVFVPIWWLATYFAAFFYPVEHDPRQDYLGWIFSFLIVMALLFGCAYMLRDPANVALQVVIKGAPDAAATPEAAALNSELQTLKSAPGISALMPSDTEKAETH